MKMRPLQKTGNASKTPMAPALALNLWVDITKYFATIFSPQQHLTCQIDKMSELKLCIDTAGMTIPDSLRVMLILRTLPSTYEVVQQTILANIGDYRTVTFLSEELYQGMTSNVNTIKLSGFFRSFPFWFPLLFFYPFLSPLLLTNQVPMISIKGGTSIVFILSLISEDIYCTRQFVFILG